MEHNPINLWSMPPLKDNDPVNHPSHYISHPSGVEAITITEHMNFCLGNAIKYIWRADMKNGIQDLKKAAWYINREIERRKTSKEKENVISTNWPTSPLSNPESVGHLQTKQMVQGGGVSNPRGLSGAGGVWPVQSERSNELYFQYGADDSSERLKRKVALEAALKELHGRT